MAAPAYPFYVIQTTSSNPSSYDAATVYVRFDEGPFDQSERDALVQGLATALGGMPQTAAVDLIEEWTAAGRDAS